MFLIAVRRHHSDACVNRSDRISACYHGPPTCRPREPPFGPDRQGLRSPSAPAGDCPLHLEGAGVKSFALPPPPPPPSPPPPPTPPGQPHRKGQSPSFEEACGALPIYFDSQLVRLIWSRLPIACHRWKPGGPLISHAYIDTVILQVCQSARVWLCIWYC